MTPRVAVLFGFGINCDHETKAVFELVGAEADRVHVNRFVAGDADLQSYDILAVPGGFSFGDHLGSGRLMGNRMRFAMRDALMAFVDAGKPIIGICNGFQVLVKTGLLPGPGGWYVAGFCPTRQFNSTTADDTKTDGSPLEFDLRALAFGPRA